MWQYLGAVDPMRVLKEELSSNDLGSCVRALTTMTTEDQLPGASPVAPYGETSFPRYALCL
jgi:hypothetical protein